MRGMILGMAAAALLACAAEASAIGQARYVESHGAAGSFPVVQAEGTATLYVDSGDWPGVLRVVKDLQSDIARVTGRQATISHDAGRLQGHVIIVGTIGKCRLLDDLAKAGKIDTRSTAGKWESFFLQVVPEALPNVAAALVIAGSDKRGTIYGIYDLSEQMGVSPWYWWADVPVRHQDPLYVKAGKYEQGEPSVKYRGIFLNDESPDLSNWVAEKFGTVRRPHRSSGPAGRRQLQQRVLRQDLRGDPAAQGQLSLAGDVEQRLQRGRSEQSPARRRIRHRHGHVAPGADAAGAEGMGPALPEDPGQLELLQEPRRAAKLLARRHPAQQELREHHHHRPARGQRHADDSGRHRWPRAWPCWKKSWPCSAR